MINMLLTLLVLCLVLYIIWWALQQISLPDPINKVVLVIFVIIVIVVLLRFIPGVNLG